MAFSEQRGQTMLVLEDPGGETLDGFLSEAMEMTQFLGGAVGLVTALSGLHKRKLIHKDVKPTNVLVDSARGQVRVMGFGITSRLRGPSRFVPGAAQWVYGRFDTRFGPVFCLEVKP